MSEATQTDLTLRAPAGTPTTLRVYRDSRPEVVAEQCTHPRDIAVRLAEAGIVYERWTALRPLDANADEGAVAEAYGPDIERLRAAGGYRSFDVISVTPETPELGALRGKFLDEHTHAEDEVRFFVSGHGLFSLHIDGQVFEVLCTAGDLISVPAGTPHWFDMGPHPDFKAVRLFTNPEGWVAQMTGSQIARGFPRLDNRPH